MFALSGFQDWAIQISVAVVAALGLIIVALINTRRNRKHTESLSVATDTIDSHESHIDSLEDRTQGLAKTVMQMIGVIGVLIILAVIRIVKEAVEYAKAPSD